jgi:hypothetical protein
LKEKQKEKKPKQKLIIFDNEKKKKKVYKLKKLSPEFIFVFDNLSDKLQNKYISALLKQNRHYKAKVIISSQYYNDITKQARQ